MNDTQAEEGFGFLSRLVQGFTSGLSSSITRLSTRTVSRIEVHPDESANQEFMVISRAFVPDSADEKQFALYGNIFESDAYDNSGTNTRATTPEDAEDKQSVNYQPKIVEYDEIAPCEIVDGVAIVNAWLWKHRVCEIEHWHAFDLELEQDEMHRLSRHHSADIVRDIIQACSSSEGAAAGANIKKLQPLYAADLLTRKVFRMVKDLGASDLDAWHRQQWQESLRSSAMMVGNFSSAGDLFFVSPRSEITLATVGASLPQDFDTDFSDVDKNNNINSQKMTWSTPRQSAGEELVSSTGPAPPLALAEEVDESVNLSPSEVNARQQRKPSAQPAAINTTTNSTKSLLVPDLILQGSWQAAGDDGIGFLFTMKLKMTRCSLEKMLGKRADMDLSEVPSRVLNTQLQNLIEENLEKAAKAPIATPTAYPGASASPHGIHLGRGNANMANLKTTIDPQHEPKTEKGAVSGKGGSTGTDQGEAPAPHRPVHLSGTTFMLEGHIEWHLIQVSRINTPTSGPSNKALESNSRAIKRRREFLSKHLGQTAVEKVKGFARGGAVYLAGYRTIDPFSRAASDAEQLDMMMNPTDEIGEKPSYFLPFIIIADQYLLRYDTALRKFRGVSRYRHGCPDVRHWDANLIGAVSYASPRMDLFFPSIRAGVAAGGMTGPAGGGSMISSAGVGNGRKAVVSSSTRKEDGGGSTSAVKIFMPRRARSCKSTCGAEDEDSIIGQSLALLGTLYGGSGSGSRLPSPSAVEHPVALTASGNEMPIVGDEGSDVEGLYDTNGIWETTTGGYAALDGLVPSDEDVDGGEGSGNDFLSGGRRAGLAEECSRNVNCKLQWKGKG
eukprot:g4811.t1